MVEKRRHPTVCRLILRKLSLFLIYHTSSWCNGQNFNKIIDYLNKNRQADARVKRGWRFFDVLKLIGKKISILAYLFRGVDENVSWRRSSHPFNKTIYEYLKYLLIWLITSIVFIFNVTTIFVFISEFLLVWWGKICFTTDNDPFGECYIQLYIIPWTISGQKFCILKISQHVW